MILVLLYLLLGTGQFSIHNAGNAFVAAYEDLGTSIPGSSDVSLFATDPIPDLNDQEEPTPLLDSTLSAGDQQDIFNGASAPLDGFFLTIDRLQMSQRYPSHHSQIL